MFGDHQQRIVMTRAGDFNIGFRHIRFMVAIKYFFGVPG